MPAGRRTGPSGRWSRGSGLVLFAADYGLIYWGEQFLDSGMTSILFALLPLVTIGFAHLYVPGDRITATKARRHASWPLSGSSRSSVIASVSILAGSGPMLAIVASTVCAAAAGVATKRHGAAMHPAALNAPAMLIGAAALALVSLVAGDGFAASARTRSTWMAIAYLAIAGSVITFLGYFTLLKTWTVTSLSFISVFTPAIALILGFVFLDERPTLWTGVGAALDPGRRGAGSYVKPQRRRV